MKNENNKTKFWNKPEHFISYFYIDINIIIIIIIIISSSSSSSSSNISLFTTNDNTTNTMNNIVSLLSVNWKENKTEMFFHHFILIVS